MDKERKKQLSLALKYLSNHTKSGIVYASTREKVMKKYNLAIEEFTALRSASINKLDENVVISRITQVKPGMSTSTILTIMGIGI